MNLRTGMFDILLVATAIMLVVSYLAYRKRKQEVAKYCAWVMLAASFYSFGYAFEIISTDVDQAKLWLRVQYIGIPFITTFWLMLAAAFTGSQAFRKKWVTALLFVVPIVILIAQFTNESHHLFYREVRFDPDSSNLSSVVLSKGHLYWLHIAYVNLECALGIGLFVRMYSKAVPIVRRQVIVMIAGAVAPWVFNIAYLTAYDEVKLDLTPFGFTLTGFTFIWGVYRFHLLRLVPVAYQKVFETMQDGVIILDYEGNLSHVNEAARAIFEELHTWNGQTVSVREIFAANPDLLARMMAPGPDEARIVLHREAAPRHYQVKVSIIYGQAEMVLGKLITLNDVTQVVLYQEQLQANADQLQELNAFKDKLFAVVAHDIRDPLALLVNLTEIIEEDFTAEGSEEARVFQEISGQVKDTHLLVENLLDWVRSQRGKINFHPMEWKLEPIVQHAAQAMKHRRERKRIRMTIAVQEGALVYADKDMVELILRNLMYNAIKYTGTDGQIQIMAVSTGDRVTVSVKDSGSGVDSEIGKKLFHEVQEGSSPGTDGERGTGLGLYLCGKFVRLNGGDIGYDSRPGQGSLFYFTLPSTEASNVRRQTWKEVDAI